MSSKQDLIKFEDISRSQKLGMEDKEVISQTSFTKRLGEIYKDNKYVFDVTSLVLVLFASIYLTFASSNYSFDGTNDELGKASTVVSTLMLFGLVFYIFLFVAFKKDVIRPTFDQSVSGYDAQITVIFVAIFFGLEFVIQKFIRQLTLSSIELEDYMFYIAIAIAETIIFVCMIQITFEALTRSATVGIIAHAIFFVIYHMNVYGSDINEMLAVFFSGLVFALAVKFTKRISIAILIHVINNILATGIISQLGVG
jgi:membrane protease YdiL (CAAX protease family)